MKTLEIAAEIRLPLGSLDDWGAQTALHGVIKKGALIGIGEMLVQDTHLAAIQQIYTLSARRGQGIGQAIVSFLAGRIIDQNRRPVYVVAHENLPSRRIVEQLGFLLDSAWGYIAG